MTRKKVQLAWIVNTNARNSTLRKRRMGLVKKVSELTTLCDVDAALIIYSPDENEPITWPSDQFEVQRVVSEFFEKPSMERERKKVDQETYLKDLDAKMQENLRKSQTRCKEAQANYLIYQVNQGHKELDQLSVAEMNEIVCLMQERMKRMKSRMRTSQPSPSQPVAAAEGPPEDLPLPPQRPY